MRKQFILGAVALGAASMLCGFDSAQTAEGVLEKVQETSASAEGFSASISLNLDAALNISDGTTDSSIPVAASGTIDAEYAISPFAMKADATMNVSALTTNQTVTEEMYMVSDDTGALKLYAKVKATDEDPAQWVVSTLDDINMDQLMEQSLNASSLSDMADWGISFELASDPVDVDGAECYLLTTTLDSTTLETVLNKSSEISGQELPAEVSDYLPLLDGLKLNLEYYVDASTYQIAKLHMDMNDSDLTVINQLITASLAGLASEDAPASTAELALNDASIDATCSFGDAPSITVPEEALAAEESGDSSSLGELASEAESAL